LQGHQDYTNYKLIFESSRIIQNHIAYNVKRINILNMVFDKRFENFRAIYNHKAAQQIDLMF
jgi:HD superfamily phosphohydrolase